MMSTFTQSTKSTGSNGCATRPRSVWRKSTLSKLQQAVRLIIRGLRAVSDFEYEYQMALMNRHLAPEMETVFMVPSLDTTYISSSLVREIARFHGDVTNLVHPTVAAALRAKFPRT